MLAGRVCGPDQSNDHAISLPSPRAGTRRPAPSGVPGRLIEVNGPPRTQGTHPEGLPAEVLDDVASVVGADVRLFSGLSGGINGRAVRVQLAGGADAVLKAVPRAHPNQLNETLRARRVVEHMRRRGYPTPAWLGVGATATHVWHLMDFVDAAPAPELTPSVVDQLMEIIELQAGQASEPYDHWSFAWRVATGQESADLTAEQLRLLQGVARLPGHSSVVSDFVERLRVACADVPPPRDAPDMVHADLATPSNVLVRGGAVVAVVDIGNAGSGTRATDLIALVWYGFQDPQLDGVRRRLWTRILDLVGWEGAAVLAAAQILLSLEWPIRLGRHDVVPGVIERGERALNELHALR
jgi:aminoglycoside phosphotransferase (APT) family kinase protein